MLCGGSSDEAKADEEIQQIANEVREQVTKMLKTAPVLFEAISYKKQTVAGTNFFIKVKVDHNKYIHVRVFRNLPHMNSTLEVHGVQEGKSEDDPVEYF